MRRISIDLRAYEHASIASAESVGIVELLMSLPEPSIDVKRAILGALNWFAATQLPDGRWARMVEIGTNQPIFSGRDGVIKYDIRQIEAERRDGYAWYGTWPQGLLDRVTASGYLARLKTELGSATN